MQIFVSLYLQDRYTGGDKVMAIVQNSLIPLLEFPYYGQLELSLPLSGAEQYVEATIPTYHADPAIFPSELISMHKTSVYNPLQFSFKVIVIPASI